MTTASPVPIEEIIGDYRSFFSDLLRQLAAARISIEGMPVSHICYRVASMPDYENIRGKLKPLSRSYAEHEFGGRLVAEFILKTPLDLGDSRSVPVIELLPPKTSTSYPEGLENAGFVVGKKLAEFKEKYKNVLTGEKNRSPHCKPAFVTFSTGKTAKFYDRSLQEVVELDGTQFLPLDQ